MLNCENPAAVRPPPPRGPPLAAARMCPLAAAAATAAHAPPGAPAALRRRRTHRSGLGGRRAGAGAKPRGIVGRRLRIVGRCARASDCEYRTPSRHGDAGTSGRHALAAPVSPVSPGPSHTTHGGTGLPRTKAGREQGKGVPRPALTWAEPWPDGDAKAGAKAAKKAKPKKVKLKGGKDSRIHTHSFTPEMLAAAGKHPASSSPCPRPCPALPCPALPLARRGAGPPRLLRPCGLPTWPRACMSHSRGRTAARRPTKGARIALPSACACAVHVARNIAGLRVGADGSLVPKPTTEYSHAPSGPAGMGGASPPPYRAPAALPPAQGPKMARPQQATPVRSTADQQPVHTAPRGRERAVSSCAAARHSVTGPCGMAPQAHPA